MPVRRAADPTSIQHVWDGIRAANAQRQMSDLHRISKYLQRVDKCTQAQAELYVQQALMDELIVELHKVTAKGAKAGTEVESYKIPVTELPAPIDDGKDWYCIDCHLAGDVIACRMCPRVYHAECAHKNKIKVLSNKSTMDFNFHKKEVASPLANSTPVGQDTILVDNENFNENENLSLNEKTVGDLIDQDASLNRLVDDVEKKLEKMEEKLDDSFIMNSSGYADSNATETNISEQLEIDKENVISSSKSSNSIIHLSDDDQSIYDETLCSICNMYKTEPELPLEKKELNYLLTFVHNRIKSWVPLTITDTVPPDAKAEWLTEAEVNWRAKQLFYQPMNMVIIESKLQTCEYTHICQFKTDVLTVRHNAGIYHGIESQEFDCADFLWKDCNRELSELSNCVDCFRHSNEKKHNKWFCLPCRVPHKLVWAKQKGYPYWPAKVIKESDEFYDVRFFGGKYERSVLHKMYIKPISANINGQVKKSTALIKSVEELEEHQKMLADPNEYHKFLDGGKKRKHSLKSIKLTPFNKMQKSMGNVKKRSKSMELPKDIYEFRDSPSNLEASTSGVQTTTSKRKRSTSPAIKVKPSSSRTTEYPTRRAVQNQINKSKAAGNVKNETSKEISAINVLPDFDDQEQFAIRDEDYEFGRGYDGSHQEVSSSTEQVQSGDEGYGRDNSDGLMPQTERQYSEAVEKTRRKLEQCRDKKELIKVALQCMQAEIDTIKDNHEDYLKKIFEAHNTQISETKKKQWCFNCEQDAIYHCCWNTAYCSPTCQQQHWQAEHKKVCRRKR